MSDTKNLLIHSGNYLFAELATKALGFISIPVYTALLTTEDYGVFSVFSATVGILGPILFLACETAISRYWFDAKTIDDFKRFVGTSIILSSIVFCATSVLYLLFINKISLQLNFNKCLTILVLPMCVFNVVDSVFAQIYSPQLKSKKIAIISSIKAYLAFVVSIVFIIILRDNKYYGQVIGSMITLLFLSFYFIKEIKPFCILCLDKENVKYILNYSVPQVPYAMSGIILAQFGRIVVSKLGGFSDAGQYSVAANIGALMMIVVGVTHQAWNPYYFRHMNNADTKSIDHDVNLIWRLTLVCGVLLSSFGYEVGLILADKSYHQYLYFIPIFVIGYIFYQWAFFYLRNVGYAKKTIWNSFTVFLSGICNIFLNIFLYKIFGIIGIPIAFVISYCIMVIISYIVNKKVIQLYSSPTYLLIKPFLLFFLFFVALMPSYLVIDSISYYFIICYKIMLASFVSYILLKDQLSMVCQWIKSNLLKK